jgi:hypothetical protein
MTENADAPNPRQVRLDGPYIATTLASFLEMEARLLPDSGPAPRQGAGDAHADFVALEAALERLARGAPAAFEFERALTLEQAYEDDSLSRDDAHRLRHVVTLMDAAIERVAGA